MSFYLLRHLFTHLTKIFRKSFKLHLQLFNEQNNLFQLTEVYF